MQSKTMDFNKISEFQHECYRVIKWFQVHKKIKLIQWLDLCTYKTKLIYTAKRKKRKELEHFHTSINVSMADALYLLYFLHTIHFSTLNLERNTLILHTLKELLYMKKTVLIRLLIFTIWKLFKVSYAETVLEIK